MFNRRNAYVLEELTAFLVYPRYKKGFCVVGRECKVKIKVKNHVYYNSKDIKLDVCGWHKKKYRVSLRKLDKALWYYSKENQKN